MRQYSDAELTFEDVPISKVDTYARYAPEFKYRQAERVARFFTEGDLSPYGPVMIHFNSGGSSLFVPPRI